MQRDLAAAAPLYKRACEGGVAASCYELALLHEIGSAVPKDRDRANALFKQACSGGDTRACAKVKQRRL
jgi:TPR repeat protein